MATYKIQRQFKLMGDKFDAQYVSSIDAKGQPTGYDKLEKHALALAEWQAVRVVSYLNKLGVKHWSFQE